MKMKTPKTRLTDVLAMTTAVGLAVTPTAFAKITAHEDFGSYAPGVSIVDQAGGGFGFTGDWIISEGNSFWGDPITRSVPADFDGNLLTTGAAYMGGGGRVEREFAGGGYTSGTIWITHVFNPIVTPNSGENQFWVCSKRTGNFVYNEETEAWDPVAGSADAYRKFGAVAGVRLIQGELMILDTSLDILADPVEEVDDPLTVGGRGEVYRNITAGDPATPVVITGPIFAAIKLNITSNTVSYYIFKPGDDLSSEANASYKVENLTVSEDRRDGGVSAARGIAMFTVSNTVAARGNIRVADTLREAAPTFNCIVDAFQSREAASVDDVGWTAVTPAYPIAAIRTSDGHIPALNAADLTANAYVSWYGTNLNVAVVVQDSDIREGATDPDLVEIYLDGDMSRSIFNPWPRNYDEVDDYQLLFTLDDSAAGVNLSAPSDDVGPENPVGYKGPKDGTNTFAGVEYARIDIDGGYIISVTLDMEELFGYENIAFEQLIGFDIAVRDRDTESSATALSSYSLCNAQNINWSGTEGFATLYLQPAISPIAWDDFSGYEVDANLIDQGDSENGWAAGWHNTWSPSWADPLAFAVRADPITFAGDLGVMGQSVRGNNSFGRVSRQLESAVDSGSSWVGFTLSMGSNMQLRLDSKGDGVADGSNSTNSDTTSVAGITLSGGGLQYLDTTKPITYQNPLTEEVIAEVYVPFPGYPYPNGNVFVAINVDFDAAKTDYYVFVPGDDLSSPANATYAVSLDLNEGRAQSFDSISLFTVFSDAGISNLRIGDDYSQLAPMSSTQLNEVAVANKAADAIVLDGIIEELWAAAPSYAITNPFGNQVANDGVTAADISGTFRLLWDDEALYVLFEVIDDELIQAGSEVHPNNDGATPTYQTDAFEIFFDGGYERSDNPQAGGWPPYTDNNDFQIIGVPGATFTTSLANQFADSTNPNKGASLLAGLGSNVTVAGTVSGNNYVAEVRIPLTSLGTPEAIAIGSWIGMEIQLEDHDLPQEAPVDGNYVYPSDVKLAWSNDTNDGWHETVGYGTVFFMGPAVPAYEFTADPGKLPVDGGDTIVTVTARFQYSDWTAVVNNDQASWVILDGGATGTGDGSFTMTLEPSGNPYTRTTAVTVGPNTVQVAQAGVLPERFEKVIRGLSATPDDNGYYTHPWLGNVTIDNFPWMHVEQVGWQWVPSGSRDTNSWIYDIELGWLWSANGIAPFWYSAELETWTYFFGTYDSTGNGDMLRAYYNFATSEIISVDLSMP